MQPPSFRPEIQAVIFRPRAGSSSYNWLIFQPSWYSSENNVVPPQKLRPTQCSSDSSEPVCYQTLPTAGFSSVLTIPPPSDMSSQIFVFNPQWVMLCPPCFTFHSHERDASSEYTKDVAGMLDGWGYIFTTTFFLSEEIQWVGIPFSDHHAG